MSRKSMFGLTGAMLAVSLEAGWAADPFADQVIGYLPGTTAKAGYNDTDTTLGSPERFTGEGGSYAGVVSIFNPPYLTTEIVSIGDGGSVTVKFDEPITNEEHPFGVDLIVFGNSGFIDADWPNGQIGNPASLFGTGQGTVEVSADGVNFFCIPGVFADQLFPTQGYNDSGPFDSTPGSYPTNFSKPVDPSLTLSDFDGLAYSEVMALYNGSGGGLPVDIANAVDSMDQPANLEAAYYVRVSHTGGGSTEIDAFVAVPEPAMALSLLTLSFLMLIRRRKRLKPATNKMQRLPRPLSPPLIVVGIVFLISMFSIHPCLAEGFIETFDDDPVAAGRFVVHDGDPARFIYNAGTQSLLAKYDSGLPTARLVRPLGCTLTQNASFSIDAAFTIKSEGFVAEYDELMSIALGFMNLETSGPDRVGFGPGDDAFDIVSFDYFPNLSFWGGPSLGPTLINSNVGQGFFAAIDFEFGQETELDDPGETDLPQDTPLRIEMNYDNNTKQATLRVWQGNQALPINMIGKDNLPGGQDGDQTTIVTTLTGQGFAVDAFALLLWEDTYAGYSTVIADVEFESIEVQYTVQFGDSDCDGDVDGDDYQEFAACISGPALPLNPGCEKYDANKDNDVDQSDFGLFQINYTGPR